MAVGVGSTAFDAFLSPKESEDLLNLVTEEQSDGWTFDIISKNFNALFSKSDHYRIGKALEMFIVCGVLDKAASQLIAVFLLYDMFKDQPLSSNPFAPLFYVILHSEQQGKISADIAKADKSAIALGASDEMKEHLIRTGFLSDAADWFLPGLTKFSPGSKWFVAALASGAVSFEIFNRNPAVFTNMDVSALQEMDTAQFDKEFLERQQHIPVIDRSGVSCIIDYPDVTVTGFKQAGGDQAREAAEALGSGQKPQPDLAFLPELMRPIPPVMPLSNQELVWLNPRMVDELKLHLDPSIFIPSKWLSVSQLLQKSVRTPLHMEEQNTLMGMYEKDETLLLGGAVMTIEDILGIVEHNPIVATEIFKRVHKISENSLKKTRFKRYLYAFLETNVSVHTMDVINRLHEAKIVPADFLPLYVSYALRKCDSGASTESAYNHRLIRLVCVFLQSAVRNKTLNLAENPDLLVEIQAFCVRQTSKEAVALYRLLKASQVQDGGGTEAFDASLSESSSSPSKTGKK
ncbi:hypothetical protein RvY_10459 [Ramazzottius varieornatus]|uniref:CCR4-NOT transcription complex subunit 11 n=1 Tax=Ramazzottius varieornatus TaxID=947166 RepID=A0A1D1VLU1_RAMVA|nr:hypothetical protein RvY_10459 [Ramazzottius varieornatus]